jgi:hypothetical protein
LKTIVSNLWLARIMGVPVRYSRSKNHYTRHRRYGRLYFKYRRLIRLIDLLEDLGFIEQKTAFFARDKNLGRQTRMWGTDKLWRLFERHQIHDTSFIQKPEMEELILLRAGKEDKGEVNYTDNEQTVSMRDDLCRYNEFVKRHEITVHLDGDSVVSNRFLLSYLQSNILSNAIVLEAVVWSKQASSVSNQIPTLPVSLTQYPNTISTSISFYFYSMTHTISRESTTLLGFGAFSPEAGKFMRKLHILRQRMLRIKDDPQEEEGTNQPKRKRNKKREAFLNRTFTLREFGIEFLIFRLVNESMHRVFNRRSFQCNGRAYGALHQKLPKELRKHIFINGKKATELDYSAYHVLMLYHRKGLDYPDDPYTVCGGADMRRAFKNTGLIAINAPSINKACKAIRKKLAEEKIPLPPVKRPLIYLIETFKATHQPIADSICSDVGIELQNIDSHIMNSILMRLMDMGILGLSVFDSVIVVEEFAEIAKGIMIEEYQKVFGFKPRL